MKKIVVTPQEAGQRLDRFLGKYFIKAPKSFVYKMLRKKNIVLNGKKAAGGERLVSGDEISLFLSDQTIENFRAEKKFQQEKIKIEKYLPKIEVLYEDESVLVLNKPVGVLSQKAERGDVSLVDWIEDYIGKKVGEQTVFKAGVCNRLDRNTTGLVVAGKTVSGLQFLNRLFKERDLDKYYLCLVHGKITEDKTIKGYLQKEVSRNKAVVFEKPSEKTVPIETAYHPMEHLIWKGQGYTLLCVRLMTGKTHQIRAHLQSIGHPVAGDLKYGEREKFQRFKRDFGVNHQLLHAWKLTLGAPEYLPEKYHHMEWIAPLSMEFNNVLEQMRKT